MRKILVSVLILMASLLLVACGGKTVTPSSQSTPTPSPTATVVSGEFSIPDDFDTYTDEAGLFSISYPEDWEVNLEVLADLEIVVQELVDSIRSGVSLESASYVFMAGIPKGLSYDPNVLIVVEPLPSTLKSIQAVASSAAIGLEMVIDSYDEISRNFTVIDGHDAAIIEYEAEIEGINVHNLVMYTMAGKTIWTVGCTTVNADFDEHEDDFQVIVHSLKIYD